MNGINRVSLLGNLGKAPEVRCTNSGTPVATLSVCTNERVKRNGEWVDHAEWHRVTVWGNTASACEEHLQAGAAVYIEGHLRTRKWQDKDGADRYSTEVEAERVVFVSGGGGNQDRDQDRGRDRDQRGGRGNQGGGNRDQRRGRGEDRDQRDQGWRGGGGKGNQDRGRDQRRGRGEDRDQRGGGSDDDIPF